MSRLAWLGTNWKERVGDLVLLAGGVLLLGGGGALLWAQDAAPAGLQSGLGWLILLALAAWMTGLVALTGLGWLKLLGPVLFYDLIQIARRQRYLILRFLVVLILSLVLCLMYGSWALEQQFRRGGQASLQEVAEFGESFFLLFMIIQFTLVGVLTPAYTAGAIADEKDRKTFEFLLATDLRNREIVLSKLLSRVANMTLVILAGLPVFAASQFFGGIDPGLLLAAFAALLITTVSLAAVSIFNSVYARKARDAILITYLIEVSYLVIASVAYGLVSSFAWLAALPSFDFVSEGVRYSWTSPITLEDVTNWLNAGNLPLVLIELTEDWDRGTPLADTLPRLLGGYALFHGIVTLVCVLWSIARVRRVALRQSYGRVHKLSLGARLGGRPRVGRLPMLWKEIHIESGLRFNWLGRAAVGLLVLTSFIAPIWLSAELIFDLLTGPRYGGTNWIGHAVDAWRHYAEGMNTWVRTAGTIVACLSLLGVAVRASSAISGERDKQTFDALLTSPLTAGEMLFAKWLGCLLSVRWAWLWLGLIWAWGVVAGGLYWWALPLLLACWLVYAAVFAGIGLWFSAHCRRTLWATVGSLLAVIMVSVGHWALTGICCFLPAATLSFFLRNDDAIEWLAKLQIGQTPPFVLILFSFYPGDFRYHSSEFTHLILTSAFGVASWALAAVVLWSMAYLKFLAVTNREPQIPRRRPRLHTDGQPLPTSKTASPAAEPQPDHATQNEEPKTENGGSD